ncbi:uncharacterized protein LOC127441653 [Myxocyprinus asiaticus]|uniref:uncharacterized protein LOC127441653 n=1 Tax=Myxocyprinus asiaticus TaxID=70543 RepID=UPI00222373E9|nr:uncharacterized protein LOC127441653 [Myxocyprinus asiaticus]
MCFSIHAFASIFLSRLLNRCLRFASRRALIVNTRTLLFMLAREAGFLFHTTAVWAKASSPMAFKEKQTLTCFLFIWLSCIDVCSFVVFEREKSLNSVGSFNKNARGRESFAREGEHFKSGAQIGRLLISQDRTRIESGDGDSPSSDLSSLIQLNIDESSYQPDDAGWIKLQPLWGQVYGQNAMYTPAVERLLGMKPKVDCVGDLMKLTVHGREAAFGSNVLIDRGGIPPLPLSQLPSECGHSLMRTWRDLIFIIPNHGCYVSQERDTFVLPLLWWGLPVKMSCSSPTLAQSNPTASCYTNGMTVKLQRGVTENLKIKVMNEWQPLLKASAKCGYSLVSHPEGMVIHAPFMPCTEAKDGMFTLILATENKFNLSCPALSLRLPNNLSDLASKNDASSSPVAVPVSSTLSPTTSTTVATTQPLQTPTTTQTSLKTSMSSTMQKLPTPHPYRIPGQSYFGPVPPNFPFVLFHPNVPPTVVPQDPPSAITQRPHAPVYPKPPQTWYPWYPKPNLVLNPDPTQSSAVPQYPSNPLLPTTTALKTLLSPLIFQFKPTSIPPQDKVISTTPMTHPVQWAPKFPPSNLVYPLYPGKPGSFAPSSEVFAHVPHWPHPSQTQPRPDVPPRLKPTEPQDMPKWESVPPILATTNMVEPPQLFNCPWYKPIPPNRSEMPSVPTKSPEVTTVSTPETTLSNPITYSEISEEAAKPHPSKHPYHSVIKGPPMKIHFIPHSYSAPKKTPHTAVNFPHAHSFHCPTCCPSISYHHHNHHHFGHPFPASFFGTSSLTEITAQMPSPFTYASSSYAPFPLIQGMGYNYGPYSPSHSSNGAAPPPNHAAMQYLEPTEGPLKPTHAPDTSKVLTRPTMCPHIFRTLASATVSPRSAMKPADTAPVIHSWGPSKLHSTSSQNAPIAEPAVYQPEMQQYVPQWDARNNVGPLSQQMEHLLSSIPPAHAKHLTNYWYQAAHSNARPPMSDDPGKISHEESMHRVTTPQPSDYDHNPLKQSTMSSQPKQTHDVNPSEPLNVHSPMPRGPESFDTYWVHAVQSN